MGLAGSKLYISKNGWLKMDGYMCNMPSHLWVQWCTFFLRHNMFFELDGDEYRTFSVKIANCFELS